MRSQELRRGGDGVASGAATACTLPVSLTGAPLHFTAQEQSLKIKEEIEGGADFSEMAVKFSTCNSAARGGKLGKFTPGQMVKEFDEAVFMTYDTGKINLGNEAYIYEPKCLRRAALETCNS